MTFYASHHIKPTPEIIAALKHEFHLDLPLPEQYLYWLRGGDVIPEDYFQGIASPRALFTMHLEALDELMSRNRQRPTVIDVQAEVCMIALMSYFEAFCKGIFAGVVNICPAVLRQFRAAGQNTAIDAADLLGREPEPLMNVGSLLAQQIDVGSAKRINNVYTALLKLSPFSKAEAKRYEHLQMDRNLLVHHGGVYTVRYLLQRSSDTGQKSTAGTIQVTPDYFVAAKAFLSDIADKLAAGARDNLAEFVRANDLPCSETQWTAIWLLAWDYTYDAADGSTYCRGDIAQPDT